MSDKAKKKTLRVYSIFENPTGDNYWHLVGSAWVNKDGSINVKLNSLPLDGCLHIRDPAAKKGEDEAAE